MTEKEKDNRIKRLQEELDYWYEEWGKMQKQIDTLCVTSAERLNRVRYKLKTKKDLSQERRTILIVSRSELEAILQHFHGKLDEEYIHGHNLGPDKYWED